MSAAERFMVGAILLTLASLFVACAIGAAAGWWAGARDRNEAER